MPTHCINWKIRLPGKRADAALDWVRQYVEQFDTSTLESVRINPGSSRYVGVYGHCLYPTEDRPTFRISCHVPGPFPCDVVTRKRPLYPKPDGSFPRAPRGCRRGLLCFDPRSGRKWYRLLGKIHLETLGEAVVWIVSHELFHFLRQTRQIKGRDNEIEADRFADGQLADYRVSAMGQPSSAIGAQLTLFD